MTLPPLMIRIGWRSRWPSGIWLPVFLLWPIVALLAVPLVLIGAVVAAAQGWLFRYGQCCAAVMRLICEVRGTRVDILDRQNRVSIRIY